MYWSDCDNFYIGPFAYLAECQASAAMTELCGTCDVRAGHPHNWVLRMPSALTHSQHTHTHTNTLCLRPSVVV